MSLYKVLSILLEYPQTDLKDALPELRDYTAQLSLPTRQQSVLENFFEHIGANSITELQQDYVRTFDLTPEHSLHLTHHLFGDDRGRGPALIDLTEYYKQYGLHVSENELPDYLPLILEFVSQLDDSEAKMFLSQTVKVLQQLAANLEKARSVYAPLIRIIEQQGQLATIAA